MEGDKTLLGYDISQSSTGGKLGKVVLDSLSASAILG